MRVRYSPNQWTSTPRWSSTWQLPWSIGPTLGGVHKEAAHEPSPECPGRQAEARQEDPGQHPVDQAALRRGRRATVRIGTQHLALGNLHEIALGDGTKRLQQAARYWLPRRHRHRVVPPCAGRALLLLR